jgi:hypothetical protein
MYQQQVKSTVNTTVPIIEQWRNLHQKTSCAYAILFGLIQPTDKTLG